MSDFWNQTRVLVTGASGFIGSNMTEALIKAGADVTAQVSTRRAADHGLRQSGSLKIVAADLTEYSQCAAMAKGMSIVFNFAALDGGADFKSAEPARIFKTNTQIVTNMLEASVSSGVSKILLMSSTEIYPPSLRGDLSETTPLPDDGISSDDGYRWSKRFTEIASAIYAKQYGFVPVVVRMGNVYGPNDQPDRGRVIPSFILSAIANRDIPIWGDIIVRKSFLFVDDCVHVLMRAVEKNQSNSLFNVAGNEYISLSELAQKIVDLTQSSSVIKCTQSKESTGARTINIKKMKAMAGDMHFTKLDDGLRKTIRYYVGRGVAA